MSITYETRRLAYEHVLNNLGKRQRDVYDSLRKYGECTANELSYAMYQDGLVASTDRNNVHPRLNELVAVGLVEVIGKRKCSVGNRMCAVYRVKSSS
jgi:hypothetical protein